MKQFFFGSSRPLLGGGPVWLALLALLLSSCGVQEHFFVAMDTPSRIRLLHPASEKLLQEAENIVHQLDAKMSTYNEDSEFSQLNHTGDDVLSSESFELLQDALRYARESHGLFDPSIGPLVRLWDVSGRQAMGLNVQDIPSPEEIRAAQKLVNYRMLELSPDQRRVRFLQEGMLVDLGGIAKGYAADKVAAFLREKKLGPAVIDLGGNIMLVGKKPHNEPWTIAIRGEDDGYLLALSSAEPRAVITSGIYQRYFEYNGKRYHHIIDPRTGYPVENDLLSLTVIVPDSTSGDVLSTLLFIMGREEAMAYAESHQNLEIITITKDLQVQFSSGVKLLNPEQRQQVQDKQLALKGLAPEFYWIFLSRDGVQLPGEE